MSTELDPERYPRLYRFCVQAPPELLEEFQAFLNEAIRGADLKALESIRDQITEMIGKKEIASVERLEAEAQQRREKRIEIIGS